MLHYNGPFIRFFIVLAALIMANFGLSWLSPPLPFTLDLRNFGQNNCLNQKKFQVVSQKKFQ